MITREPGVFHPQQIHRFQLPLCISPITFSRTIYTGNTTSTRDHLNNWTEPLELHIWNYLSPHPVYPGHLCSSLLISGYFWYCPQADHIRKLPLRWVKAHSPASHWSAFDAAHSRLKLMQHDWFHLVTKKQSNLRPRSLKTKAPRALTFLLSLSWRLDQPSFFFIASYSCSPEELSLSLSLSLPLPLPPSVCVCACDRQWFSWIPQYLDSLIWYVPDSSFLHIS